MGEPFMRRPIIAVFQLLYQTLTHTFSKIRSASENLLDGLNEFGAGGDLGNVSRCAGLQDPQSILILRMRAKNKHGQLWLGLFDLAQNFHPEIGRASCR